MGQFAVTNGELYCFLAAFSPLTDVRVQSLSRSAEGKRNYSVGPARHLPNSSHSFQLPCDILRELEPIACRRRKRSV